MYADMMKPDAIAAEVARRGWAICSKEDISRLLLAIEKERNAVVEDEIAKAAKRPGGKERMRRTAKHVPDRQYKDPEVTYNKLAEQRRLQEKKRYRKNNP